MVISNERWQILIMQKISDEKRFLLEKLHSADIVDIQLNATLNPVMFCFSKGLSVLREIIQMQPGVQIDSQQMPHMTIPLHMLLWERGGM